MTPHLRNSLKLLGIDPEECKEELLDTIKVPIKLGLISQKLPKPQYSERGLSPINGASPSQMVGKKGSSHMIDNATRNVRGSQYKQ